MKTSFTPHAWSRVRDRLSLSAADVSRLLDYDLVVDVGTEPGTNRVHRVFYSVLDYVCFVAVQDKSNGDVITVLPLDFHENIAWAISVAAQDEARMLASGVAEPDEPPRPVIGERVAAQQGPQAAPPPQFRLMAYVRDGGCKIRARNLGSWPTQPYDGRVERLLDDDAFFVHLRDVLARHGIDANDVERVYVRLGKRGEPVGLSLHKAESSDSAGDTES